MMPGICDVIPPPVVEPSPGHKILCHLPLDTLEAMAPVITMEGERAPALSQAIPGSNEFR